MSSPSENGPVEYARRAVDALDTAVGTTVSFWDKALGVLFSPFYWLRRRLRGTRHIFRATSFSLLLGGLLVLALSPAQSLESVYVIAENWAAGDRGQAVWLVLTMVFASVSMWYWARVLLYILVPWKDSWSPGLKRWWQWVPRVAGMLPVVAVGVALVRMALLAREAGGSGVTQQLFALGAVVVAIGLALLVGYWKRIPLLKWYHGAKYHTYVGPVGTHHHVRDLDWGAKSLVAVSTVLFVVIFYAVYESDGQALRSLGAIPLLLLAVTTWLSILNWILLLGVQHKIPLVRIVVACGLIAGLVRWGDNHDVRVLEGRAPSIRTTTHEFGDWLNSRQDLAAYQADRYPVFFIAAEGGGIRAAYFTAQVLGALEDRCPGFAQHVFAISGISGGSLGASAYAALVAERGQAVKRTQCAAPADSAGPFQQTADRIFERDLLTPVLASGLYLELAQRLIPKGIGKLDRALALEVGLEEAWASATGGDTLPAETPFTRSLYALRQDATSIVPALFLNTTEVETGDRMVASSLALDPRHANRILDVTSLQAKPLLRLSTAAVLSARFPFVTPEGAFMRDTSSSWFNRGWGRRRRFVDGGYFDGTGAATIHEVLNGILEDSALSKRIIPIVIYIGFDPGSEQSASSVRRRYASIGFNDALSPFRTLLNVRTSHGNYALAQLRTAVGVRSGAMAATRRAPLDRIQYLPFVAREDKVPLILGWQLSKRARETMASQLRPKAMSDTSGALPHDSFDTVARLLNRHLPGT
jgi:hypothetical protein